MGWHTTMSQPTPTGAAREQSFVRGLNLFDATMVVIGAMIGSGIFIVTADMSRLIGSPGWMLVAWAVTGVLTFTGLFKITACVRAPRLPSVDCLL
jgi:APA family basic amino acid/polyamine antiporter